MVLKKRDKKNEIIISALAVSPFRGSEYIFAWRYLENLPNDYFAHVFVGMTGDYIGDLKDIKVIKKKFKQKNFRLIPVKINKLAYLINLLNSKLKLSWFVFFSYSIWSFQIYLKAKKLCKERNIKITHHLNVTGFREPGFLWLLGKPHVWGPIAGSTYIPIRLWPGINFKEIILFNIKNAINLLTLAFAIRIRLASNKSFHTFTCNEHYKNFSNFIKVDKYEIIPEQQPLGQWEFKNKDRKNLNKLVAIGSINARKNFHILVRVMNKIVNIDGNKNFILTIIGDGEKMYSLKNYVAKFKLRKNIIIVGKVPYTSIKDYLENSGIFLFPSLADAASAVLLEAITFGLITISFNKNGAADIVKDKLGILIEVNNVEEIINNYARAIYKINNDKSLQEYFYKNLEKYTKNNSPETVSKKYKQIYETLINM